MNLSEICIRKPVLAIVLNLILVVVGVIGYQRLDIRFFPELEQPVVSISVYYKGADAQLMENSVTRYLENYLSGVDNIDYMTSSSSNSWSTVYIRFQLGGNFEQEVNQVRDKISSAREKLPTEADPATITVGGIEGPVLSLGFTDEHKDSGQIRDYVRRYVWPQLRQVQGVGGLAIHGSSDYAMRIWLDPDKMASHGVTAPDIKKVIEANNIDFPAGSIQGVWRNFSVKSNTQLSTPAQFRKILVYNTQGKPVRLGDVADVELGYTSLQNTPFRINGTEAIDVEVKPLKSANPINVAARVRKLVAKLKQNLPKGMHLQINYDQSVFLKASIHETFKAMWEAILLVVIVVFIFLGSLRASMVPIITIPLCLITVFGIMYIMGFTINVMTLLALVLAIGLVVDDAIVMLENIHRYIEQGQHPFWAAIKGSREIMTAVIAMTITLAAVYAPIGFAQGYSAVIFKEFAFTLAAAVIISGWVALTLSPMMCSKVLSKESLSNKFVHTIDELFARFSQKYQLGLRYMLNKRLVIVAGLIAVTIVGVLIFHSMEQEFVPKEDTGLITVSIKSPTGASIDYADRFLKQMEGVFSKVKAIDTYYSSISRSALAYVVLKDWHQRQASTADVVKLLITKLANITGIEAYPQIPDPVDYGEGGYDVTVQLMTPGNFITLYDPAKKLEKLFKANPGFTHINNSMHYDDRQFKLTINRDLAAQLHVNMQDIADTVSVMLGGSHINDMFSDGYAYNVDAQVTKKSLENFQAVNKLYVRSAAAVPKMIPLASLVNLTPSIGQPSLPHYNRMRTASISANLAPGYSYDKAVNYLTSVLPKVLNSQINYAYSGKIKEFIASQGGMVSIFVLALLFIYLVLSAQFGSFIDPFIILLTVPLSIVGAILCLRLIGGSINLYTEIGFVTLIGMITKHGILITQFANNLRQEGADLIDAVVQAAATRLRPILMTTAAMVLGTIPLALAVGPGSASRQQIGWVIVGGLSIGTFFSLIVVPIAYSFFGKFKNVTQSPPPASVIE